ncbi:hypothetical protein LUZ61_019691 [Rhynchospora tenuis]|uniref:Reverse transcriptase zinc-binding domain-containing protein n=1 Tax=Rhynchospora tenuis TaxID=198213 RepID=A0AAD6EN50_9POAL|nr:hypothetical protein LUZ61_019691 [Rhynchospora tenuis]
MRSAIAKIIAMKRIKWKQRSGLNWLKFGDCNSNFFHLNASSRRALNNINYVEVDGQRFHDQVDIAREFLHFYKEALGTPPPQHPPYDLTGKIGPAADALQRFISNANQLLTGPVIIPPKAVQFADDTIILMEAHPRNLAVISLILKYFSMISGLAINDHKLAVVPISIPSSRIETVRNLLGCIVKEFPITYLGMSLSVKKPKRVQYLPLIQTMHERLQGWKSKFLSLGGRLVVVKAVLAALPLHIMQAFKMPQWLLDKMDHICRAFLWKGTTTCLGGHCLVNWETCCLPKRCGGLGILHLKTQNEALLAKWLWKLFSESNSVWTSTIRELYGTSDIDTLLNSNQISYGLRDVLCTYPLVQSSITTDDVESSIRWKWTSDGAFSSKSAYLRSRDPGMRSPYHSLLWKGRAPLKTKIFYWLAMKNRLNTRENMHNKGWQVIRTCPLCQSGIETSLHLFMRCPFSLNIWDHFLLQGTPSTNHDELWEFWLSNRPQTSIHT